MYCEPGQGHQQHAGDGQMAKATAVATGWAGGVRAAEPGVVWRTLGYGRAGDGLCLALAVGFLQGVEYEGHA